MEPYTPSLNSQPYSQEYTEGQAENEFSYRERMYKGEEHASISLKERVITWLQSTKHWLANLINCLFEICYPKNEQSSPSDAPLNSISNAKKPTFTPPILNSPHNSPKPVSPPINSPKNDFIDTDKSLSLLISPARVKPIADLSPSAIGGIVAIKQGDSYISVKILKIEASGEVVATNGEREVKAQSSNLYSIGLAEIQVASDEEWASGVWGSLKAGDDVIIERTRLKGKVIKMLPQAALVDNGEILEIYPIGHLIKVAKIALPSPNTNIVIGSLIQKYQTEDLSLYRINPGDIVAIPYDKSRYQTVMVSNVDRYSIYYNRRGMLISYDYEKARRIKSEYSVTPLIIGEKLEERQILASDPVKPFANDELVAYKDSFNAYRVVQYGNFKFIDADGEHEIIPNTLFRFRALKDCPPSPFGVKLRPGQVYANPQELKEGEFVALKDWDVGFSWFRSVKLIKLHDQWRATYQISDDPKDTHSTDPSYLYNIQKDYPERMPHLRREQLGEKVSLEYVVMEEELKENDYTVGEYVAYIQIVPFCFRTARIVNLKDGNAELSIGDSKITRDVKLLLKLNPQKPIETMPNLRQYKIGDKVEIQDLNPIEFASIKSGDLAAYNGEIVSVTMVGETNITFNAKKGTMNLGEWHRKHVKPLLPKFNERNQDYPKPFEAGSTIQVTKHFYLNNSLVLVLYKCGDSLIVSDKNHKRWKVGLNEII